MPAISVTSTRYALEDVSVALLLGTKSEATLGEPSSSGTGEGSAQAAIESANTSASESDSTDLSRLVMVGDSFPAGAQHAGEAVYASACAARMLTVKTGYSIAPYLAEGQLRPGLGG